jgi:hypothetical protein
MKIKAALRSLQMSSMTALGGREHPVHPHFRAQTPPNDLIGSLKAGAGKVIRLASFHQAPTGPSSTPDRKDRSTHTILPQIKGAYKRPRSAPIQSGIQKFTDKPPEGIIKPVPIRPNESN